MGNSAVELGDALKFYDNVLGERELNEKASRVLSSPAGTGKQSFTRENAEWSKKGKRKEKNPRETKTKQLCPERTGTRWGAKEFSQRRKSRPCGTRVCVRVREDELQERQARDEPARKAKTLEKSIPASINERDDKSIGWEG